MRVFVLAGYNKVAAEMWSPVLVGFKESDDDSMSRKEPILRLRH